MAWMMLDAMMGGGGGPTLLLCRMQRNRFRTAPWAIGIP